MRRILVVLAALAAASRAQVFIADNKEYVYETEATMIAGTMDHASHSAGLGVRMKTRLEVTDGGKTITVKFENVKYAQYVGVLDTKTWPWDSLNYKDSEWANPPAFAVKLDSSGLFKEMVMPDVPMKQQNIMKAWAAQLQINTKKIKAGEKAFVSEEQMVEGTCDMTYVVTEGAVRKSVSHLQDCHNFVYRLVDDMRGRKCGHDHREEADHEDGEHEHEGDEDGPPVSYPASIANTVYLIEKSGGNKFKINALISSGSFFAKFYGDEGSAQIVHTNSTSRLVNVKSAGGLSASGSTITDLRYKFDDEAFAWDKERDLKAREPFFSSGMYFDNDMAEISRSLKDHITAQKDLLEDMGVDAVSLRKAHQKGIQAMLPAFYALDYASLRSLADELMADKSDTGTLKANVFTEMLGSAGTSAAALVIRDLLMEGKFDNDRDASLALTKIPFHIRRPNKQLVEEFEKLLDFSGTDRFTKMAIPLTFAHLVRITCVRAGPGVKDPETIDCFKNFASKYVKKFWDQYKATDDHQEKGFLLSVLSNIRFGGQSEIMKPLIEGKMEQCNQLRTMAMWSAGWEVIAKGDGFEFFAPLFSDRKNSAELRISALEMMFFSKLNAAQLASIVTVLYGDTDYEVRNYAYALFARYASSIDPCDEATAHLAGHFLKFMRQYSQYETDWGFGVSKTYTRQFQKKKYGYGGSYMFYVIGSQHSTTPVSIGAAMSSTRSNSYRVNLASAHIRIEGLAKGLLRKFKSIDPSIWKTADLQQVLSSDMGIREKPDQPVKVQITVRVKGTIVAHRQYDESDGEKEGKIGTFFSQIKDMGDAYSINHVRAINLASAVYEQPTNLGIPMATMSSMTAIAHITATVKRGNHRGLLFRDIEYDMHFFAQGNRAALIPTKGVSYGIMNDRVYYAHFPRKFVLGVNPIKKELKISVSRPEFDHPTKLIMHSVTFVIIRGNSVSGKYNGQRETCPQCKYNYVVVSKGPDAVQQKTIVDIENDKRGAKLYAEYFGCEMDITPKNRFGNILSAFMPYNKNPKTPYTSIALGLRQIRAFLVFFPRTEQCGVMATWSQSQNNPIKEIEVSIRGNVESNGERMFFRGRKWFIKALIKGKGEPADRTYRVNVAYEFTPGYLENKIKVQLNRAPVKALGITPYSVCMALENKYPEFSKEFLGFNEDEDMKVTGKAMVQYGEGSQCDDTDGEIRVKFEHSTTEESREALKNKWYYKKCMEDKNSPAWSGSKGWPVSETCYMAVADGTSARKYTWNVEIIKMSDRLKKISSSVRSAIKAGLLPWDLDSPAIIDGEIGPYMNMKATLKNDEKLVDIEVETKNGREEYTDMPLRLNWSNKLRGLKFSGMIKKLMDAKIINPCIATNAEIRTMDNITFAYEPSSCWTLNSATCGPTPSYAVFSRKGASGSKLDAIVFIGGHKVEFSGSQVKVEGSPQNVAEGSGYTHMHDGTEIFKIFRWGSTYNLYSFLKVWVTYDGNYVEVVPAPSTKGQHCGICGNYNRQQKDEFSGKSGDNRLDSAADLVKEWQWKC